MITMGAAKFKAHCLSVMDEVKNKGTHVVITKNGKPIAKLVPISDEKASETPLDFLYIGGGRIVGDIESPVVREEDFEAVR